MQREIYCAGCQQPVFAVLVTGDKIYPHRDDLKTLLFWQCDTCKNYVGVHKHPRRNNAPLGVICTPEVRNARRLIHELLDPIWKNGLMTRSALYQELSRRIGISFHTADITTLEQARSVWKTIKQIERELHAHRKKRSDS